MRMSGALNTTGWDWLHFRAENCKFFSEMVGYVSALIIPARIEPVACTIDAVEKI